MIEEDELGSSRCPIGEGVRITRVIPLSLRRIWRELREGFNDETVLFFDGVSSLRIAGSDRVRRTDFGVVNEFSEFVVVDDNGKDEDDNVHLIHSRAPG